MDCRREKSVLETSATSRNQLVMMLKFRQDVQHIGANMEFRGCILLCSMAVASDAGAAESQEPVSGFMYIRSVDVPYDSDPEIP